MDGVSYAAWRKLQDPQVIDQRICNIWKTEQWEDFNCLKMRLRHRLIRMQLNEDDKHGNGNWSRARSIYCAFEFAGFDALRLQKLVSAANCLPVLVMNDIHLVLKLNVGGKNDSRIEMNAISEILQRPKIRRIFLDTECSKSKQKETIREALNFSLLSEEFDPIHVFSLVLDPVLSQRLERLLLFMLVGMMSHYFPIRGSSIMGLKLADIDDMIFRDDCAVLSFANIKLSKKPTVWRGLPRWFGMALKLYVARKRPNVGACPFVFIDPVGRKPLYGSFRTLRKYLNQEYSEFVNTSTFIGGNMKRKVFATCMEFGRAEFAKFAMEHSERTSIKYYCQEGLASAVETYRCFINKFQTYCEHEGANPPVEWHKIINYDDRQIQRILISADIDVNSIVNN